MGATNNMTKANVNISYDKPKVGEDRIPTKISIIIGGDPLTYTAEVTYKFNPEQYEKEVKETIFNRITKDESILTALGWSLTTAAKLLFKEEKPVNRDVIDLDELGNDIAEYRRYLYMKRGFNIGFAHVFREDYPSETPAYHYKSLGDVLQLIDWVTKQNIYEIPRS